MSLTRTALLALSTTLLAGAAHAETWTVHPGASCSAEGAIQQPTNGSLMNLMLSTTPGYSTFSCPVPRNFPTNGTVPSTYVYLNVKATDGLSDFYCVLRAVDAFGDISDSDSLTVPKSWNVSNVKKVWGGALQVSGPSNQLSYSVILRCQVPHHTGTPGGIISYMVRH